MTSEKTSKQTALPMGTTPASDAGTVTINVNEACNKIIREHAAYRAAFGETADLDAALHDLIVTGASVTAWAHANLSICASPRASRTEQPAAAPVVELPMPARTGDAIISDVARKIAEHTVACGAGFWTGGVPEVRASLGVDADGQTIAAAFRRIERGQVAGVGATQCPQNHRAGGSYALWTVTVAPKKPAT